ncbi:MAG: glycosyltransferase family 4 protein [Barnesiella sp.]
MEEERISQGWSLDVKEIPYVKCSYEDKELYEECLKIGECSDVVLFGSAPFKFIEKRVRKNKLTFYIAERLFRRGFVRAFYPPSFFKILKRFIVPGRKSNFYMLCASGYTAYDVNRLAAFRGRCYKWAHFTEVREYDIEQLMCKKSGKIEILWAGRFLKLKHPEYAIMLAKKLKEEDYTFHINMIGRGEEEAKLKLLVNEYGLENNVSFLGFIEPEKVRNYMERSDIFLFTSDFREGWGAVLNESMNAGCAVVASHAIGAVPFLLEHEKTGLIYKNGDFQDFYEKVVFLINNEKNRKKMGKNAYLNISKNWTPEIAAIRFLKTLNDVFYSKSMVHFSSGVLSVADCLNNHWFKTEQNDKI